MLQLSLGHSVLMMPCFWETVVWEKDRCQERSAGQWAPCHLLWKLEDGRKKHAIETSWGTEQWRRISHRCWKWLWMIAFCYALQLYWLLQRTVGQQTQVWLKTRYHHNQLFICTLASNKGLGNGSNLDRTSTGRILIRVCSCICICFIEDGLCVHIQNCFSFIHLIKEGM